MTTIAKRTVRKFDWKPVKYLAVLLTLAVVLGHLARIGVIGDYTALFFLAVALLSTMLYSIAHDQNRDAWMDEK